VFKSWSFLIEKKKTLLSSAFGMTITSFKGNINDYIYFLSFQNVNSTRSKWQCTYRSRVLGSTHNLFFFYSCRCANFLFFSHFRRFAAPTLLNVYIWTHENGKKASNISENNKSCFNNLSSSVSLWLSWSDHLKFKRKKI
jgi:hypothetical protein